MSHTQTKKPAVYRETQKFNLWTKYFMDKSNKETFLNATKSAVKAYGYTSPAQYHLASVTGSKNMRKYEFLATSVLDMIGFNFGELIKIGMKKVLDGNYKDWESFMQKLGNFEDKPIQNNVHFHNFNDIREAIAQSRRERGLPA